jgi:hypothetical protein
MYCVISSFCKRFIRFEIHIDRFIDAKVLYFVN